ncbi:MAG: DUF4365 domain-containing protein [Xanthomonadales bacterium]|nr:DUF4365 domain-containing protein [Xanthomonadales bacterium]
MAGLFERIRWAPLENRDRHDLGTDLLVAARDPRRFDRGALIGVQVKGGPHWFSEPVLVNDEITGWWHRNDNEHFDYWIKHQLPHLLVLYDIDARTGYWVHVTSDRCESTGKGCKVFVPKTNTISEVDVPRLLEIALAQRGSISLEGTNFDAASTQVPPSDRLRYALLIPRLVAPHANRSASSALEPEEAIALLVLLHVSRLKQRLETNRDWPELDKKPLNSDWRWQFAFALWRFIAYDDKSSLKDVQATAVREDWRTASTVLLAGAELSIGVPREGAYLVAEELARDKAAPVDHAWLHLHASRFADEAGLRDEAKSHASQAITLLTGIGDDPTASLLSGVGYRALLNLASWRESAESISGTLRAGDNAGSWWRDQQLRWALDAAAMSQFREWAHDTSSRWDAEPPAQQLLPSRFMALFSADRAGLAAAEARLGRFGSQCAKTDDEFRSAYSRLLSSGDKASVVLAGRRAWRCGPAQVLAELSTDCVPERFSPGRVDALLEFWGAFGDLGMPTAADDVVLWCLNRAVNEEAANEPHDKAPRVASLLGAIKGALGACSASVLERVAAELHSVPVHWTHLKDICSVAEELERLAPTALDAELFLDLASRSAEHSELARLLGLSAKLGSEVARVRLLQAAKEGNLLAAAIGFEDGFLTEGIAEQSAQTLVQLLEKERHQAARGSFGFGRSVDTCLFLVNLSFSLPRIARWTEVMSYLGDNAVIADHKESSIYRIVRDLVLLPEEAVDLLLHQITGLRTSRFLPTNFFDMKGKWRSAAGLAALVQFGVGGQSDLEVETFVAGALAGEGDGRQMAWWVLREFRPAGYDVLALQSLGDSDPSIRGAAARFVGRRVEGGADTPTLRRAVERICVDGSVLVPLALVTELTNHCPEWAKGLIHPVRDHPSAKVRAATRGIVDATP